MKTREEKLRHRREYYKKTKHKHKAYRLKNKEEIARKKRLHYYKFIDKNLLKQRRYRKSLNGSLMLKLGDMKTRCYNKKSSSYKNYGGRGIKICKTWINNPEKFIEWCKNNGYKKSLHIDRINNDGDYKPSNCKFSTLKENARNKRNTVTDFINKKRRCCNCKHIFNIDKFYRSKNSILGREYVCKECSKLIHKNRRI